MWTANGPEQTEAVCENDWEHRGESLHESRMKSVCVHADSDRCAVRESEPKNLTFRDKFILQVVSDLFREAAE